MKRQGVQVAETAADQGSSPGGDFPAHLLGHSGFIRGGDAGADYSNNYHILISVPPEKSRVAGGIIKFRLLPVIITFPLQD